MTSRKIIFVLIPITIFIASIFYMVFSSEQTELDKKIIQNTNFIKIETTEPKTDDEISKEIEEKYNKIEEENESSGYKVLPRDWQKSGPFSIDRKEYALGEKIFLTIENLGINEKGQISILRTLNQTHYKVWTTYSFDGEIDESFNIYFEPKISKVADVCSKNDLIGDWVMVFQNTNYENLRFSINDKIVTGDEDSFNEIVC